MHYTFDPFQVYCYQRRAEISQKNIKANSSTITSLIATEWRKLPQNEKQKYVDVANNLMDNAKRTANLNKSSPIKVQTKKDRNKQEEVSPPPSAYIDIDTLPHISVIRRGTFGQEIEMISKQFHDNEKERDD